MLATHFHKGGAEKQLGFVARELARNGAEVVHVSIAEQAIPSTFHEPQLRFISLGVRHFRSLSMITSVLGLFWKECPDVVLSCVTPCDFLGYLWSRLMPCKWVMREPNTYDTERKQSRIGLRLWLGLRADTLIANNQGGFEFWKELRSDKATFLVPNLTYLEELRSLARAAIEVDQLTDPYFICVGRLEAQKNFSQAIAGFEKFLEAYPDFQLCIVGAGSEEAKLKNEAVNFGISDRIVFAGYMGNPLPLIAQAEGLILPSRFEGCPNVAMEAAILGVPLVLSGIPANRAIFDDASACFFDLDDPSGTQCAMERCVARGALNLDGLVQTWSAEINGGEYYKLLTKTLAE